ncbi:hypothetical protein RSAG8_07709, partial [Rhizoctonia solani AG-8 WAC10335]
MPVEVKRLPGHHKAGMKQLSRYARAVFAHQLHRRHLYGMILHRRHLYGMIVCGREATFVRFDRAGILYSGRIDMLEQSGLFIRALASLLMLDRIDEGLDPAFTFKRNSNGRLIYYIDLPESEIAKPSVESTFNVKKNSTSTRNERMRRFEVIEQLCHRQSICGRATIVLRIREVLGPEQQAKANGKGKSRASTVQLREYALKLIWRDPQRDSEGDVLEQVHGMFGLAQYAGHWDVSMPGKCRCTTPVGGRCKDPKCADKTAEVDGLEVCDRLRDISILVPNEQDEEHDGPTTRSTRAWDEGARSNANGPKRRKSNSKRSVPVQQEDNIYTEPGEVRKRRVIDYRTGTPAFMSTTVLAVKKGRHYNHSFLDDLQSFFWLILWSAAAHLDDDQDRPTADAQKVLDKMNRSDLESICEWKSQLLGYCARDPDTVIETLDGFDNEWGTSGMLQHALLKLGTFLDEATYVKTRGELESSPGSTILSFVEIIKDAIQYED